MEDYYNIRAKQVLSLAVEKLTKYEDLTFIWTDTCFLERWWREQNNKTRNDLRKLVQSGRFEIALGAWVSADECISHYYAYVDQLIEGYYWIREHLGVFPNVSFNMDQFGASASVNYLRSLAGVKISFVNHLHKGTKKYFRKHRLLEFTNRQLSDETGKDDTFIHIEPFDDLSFKGSCGPSKMVCFGLDLRTFKLPRPGEISFNLPKFLNGMPFWSIHQFAKHLVTQMRIKSDGYLHNVILLPLGNDILYHTEPEWENEYRNLKIIMEYINSHEPFNVKMKFGTVYEYYEEVMRNTQKHKIKYPLGAGDYLPYTRGPKYWSGYFTTRQFMKRLGRELQESVRATDLLMSFLFNDDTEFKKKLPGHILSKLVYSREQMYIFQHHDAITGTAEEVAVKDYKKRLSSALVYSQEVMSYILKIAMQKQSDNTALACKGEMTINSTVTRVEVEQLTKQAVIEVKASPTQIIVFNSYTRKRTDLINVVLKSKNNVIVTGPNNSVVEFDIEVSKDTGTLSFIADLPPVSISIFNIVTNSVMPFKSTLIPEKTGNYFLCENADMKLTFSLAEGTPLSLCSNNGNICTDFQIDLLHYTPISDAYTFPDSKKYKVIKDYSRHRIFNGKTHCSIEFFFGYIKLKYVLQKVSGLNGRRLQMNIHDNLSKSASNNFEGQFAFRVKTNIQNGRTYYTDSNGLQLMKRTYRSHLSFGSNVYPVTSTAVIQDKSKRLTVHSVQPNAAVSRESGSLDIMVDRVVTRENDGTVRRFKGDTKDNLPTSTQFFFQLEGSLPPKTRGRSRNAKTQHSLISESNFKLTNENPSYIQFFSVNFTGS
ncbi:alpha-mannosidase 2-like [Ruditapes philippinarum]|uniref:alpha-mannosidase 2-like n=1 Tax=Ruditapes philippinarum TaxID=129788 RepID=UPI00295B5EB0|nr:alpha-mannosidase 2-like [Ruditapes philippinarum]